ncbi:hypothetical protein KP79_PYT22225 [Mizuhopecten yessoensis]|uniref:N-acetyltransferase domain-containing protein n=3 Tax=Mizuhopecten yessoensis TaxID=6573 RepID=A0A210QRY4_MIZYE|nr:hypothetical protein KP79_PYT22225 [Mizuhopecten yessoensis]
MESSDIPQVHGLLAEQGWVMEKAYFDCAFKTDPRGFVVAETPSRKLIGCHGFLAHDPSMASMGLWIVDRESQSERVGHQMFGDLAQRFSAGTNIGTFIWPHNVDRIKDHYGISVLKSYMTWYNYGRIDPDTLKPCTDERFKILPASDVDMADILSYDAEIHQIPREAYIQNWIHHEQSKTYVAMRNNKVCGYGVLRSQDSFNQIAPLYADNKHIAKAIIRHLAKHVPGQTVGFSSPLQNSSAIDFAEANNMMKYGRPLLMIFYKNKIDIDTDRVYAVSSNSFGNC